tara:strand:+ start:106 stop:309 length:204 start_codon:yes stop_codon:yes gene_type:complete
LEPRIEKQSKDFQIPVSDGDLLGFPSVSSRIQEEKSETQHSKIFGSSQISGDLNENCEVMKRVHKEF